MSDAPLRGVICDFGGVLTTPLVEAFAAVQAQAGIPPQALGEALAGITAADGSHPLHELETGRMTEREFMTKLSRALRAQLGRDVAMLDFGERYFSHLRPNPAVIDYMRALRDRGYRMALLTNNVREWEPRWRAMLPVDEIFEWVVDSAFVGMRKPDPAIYRLTLERMKLAGAECVFLDDVEINCETARTLDMTAVQFSSTAQALSDLTDALSDRGAPGAPDPSSPAQLSEPRRSHR